MIYEMRTYDLKPRSLPEVEKRFGEIYEKRKKYSELAAFWHTEIGPLNQIIHVWPYKDLEERGRIRAAAVKDGAWPPDTGEFIVAMRSEIMIPFAISPELKPGKMGPYFEMRTYTYAPGDLAQDHAGVGKGDPGAAASSARCARRGIRNWAASTSSCTSGPTRRSMRATTSRKKAAGRRRVAALGQEARRSGISAHRPGKQDPDARVVLAAAISGKVNPEIR